MDFAFPFSDSFTLPIDAGPNDSRIEFDGILGQIRIYDSGILVGLWDHVEFEVINSTSGSYVRLLPGSPNATIFLHPPNRSSGTMNSASISGDLSGVDEIPYLRFVAPFITGGTDTAPIIDLFSSVDGSGHIPHINLAPNASANGKGGYVDIPQDTNKTSDLRIGNISLGRGEIGYVEQTNDDALVAGVEELVDILELDDKPVIANRKYDVEGEASFSGITGRAIFRLRYTEDGTNPTTASTLLKQCVYNTNAAGTTGGTGRINARYVPASNLNLSIGLFIEVNANMTAIASQPGYLKVQDVGA